MLKMHLLYRQAAGSLQALNCMCEYIRCGLISAKLLNVLLLRALTLVLDQL